ncbi:MAG: hypothetical protein AAGA25_03405 [Planctomycetota bacterium]
MHLCLKASFVLVVPVLAGLMTAGEVLAKPTPWSEGGRIAISADGNPDADSDDVGATPLTLAALAKAGHQADLVHYDFNNWMEYKPIAPKKNRLWHSAMGGQARWGFDPAVFFDISFDPEGAVESLTKQINQSTADDPLYLIAAGPVEVIYRAMVAADADRLDHVIYITHHRYNNYYKPRMWHRNLDDILALHPGLKIIAIKDQNQTLKTKKFDDWFWLRDHKDPNLQWIFERLEASRKPDASDAGMVTWLIGLNGNDELIEMDELVEWFGTEPIEKNGKETATPPAPQATKPEIPLPDTEVIFQEVDGRIVIEAESVPVQFHWQLETSEPGYTGEGYLRYMQEGLKNTDQLARGVLTYKLRITEPGTYRMALKHSHRGAPTNDAKSNQCYTLMGIEPAPFGIIRRTSHPLTDAEFKKGTGFTFKTQHENYGTVARTEGKTSVPVYELDKGDHYFFIAGRSNGYRLDKIHLFKEGVDGFGDDSIPATPMIDGKP